MSAERYAEKPLLRLVECYILRAIGELSAADAQRLQALAPKLGGMYRVSGTWWEIVAQVLRFPPTAEAEFRKLWQHNQRLAAQAGEKLLAEDFARMVVDQNFAAHLD